MLGGGIPPSHLIAGKECNKQSTYDTLTEEELGNNMLTPNTELHSCFHLTRTDKTKLLMLCKIQRLLRQLKLCFKFENTRTTITTIPHDLTCRSDLKLCILTDFNNATLG